VERARSKRRQDPDAQRTADYTRSPLGTWHVVVTVGGRRFREADGIGIHETFLKALDLFDQASCAHGGQPCGTIHTLDGDPAAFAALAEAHQLRVPEGCGMGATFWTEG
jgi:hypothetical protein